MDLALAQLKALSDQNRLRLVYALSHTPEICACQFNELLDVKGATTSNHLAQLAQAGIVEGEKFGRWIYFRLSPTAPKDLLDWTLREFSKSQIAKEDKQKIKQIMMHNPVDLCRTQRGEI